MEMSAPCTCGHDALTHAAMRFKCLRCDCDNFAPVPHTPGPWKIVDHRKDESCLYIESEHDGIASVFTDTLTPEAVIDANARLIASAPNLREALDKIGRAACGEDQIDSALDDTELLGWIYRATKEVAQPGSTARTGLSHLEAELLAALHVARSRMAYFTCEESIQVDAAIGHAEGRANV